MSKLICCFFLLIAIPIANATPRQIRIAVLDTGYNKEKVPGLKVCPNGLIDLSGEGIEDFHGHGNNILNIIASGLQNVDYCVYIYKIYSSRRMNSLYASLLAYSYIEYLPEVNIINYSSSGPVENKEERNLINSLIKKHIIFIAAAGNDNQNLDIKCDIYPACYKNVVSVGALDANRERLSSSNYGKFVKTWEYGDKTCFNNACFSGTSQATANATVRAVKDLYYAPSR